MTNETKASSCDKSNAPNNNNNEIEMLNRRMWPAASRYMLFICPGSLNPQNRKRLKSSFKRLLALFGFEETIERKTSRVTFPSFIPGSNSARNKNKSRANEKCLYC